MQVPDLAACSAISEKSKLRSPMASQSCTSRPMPCPCLLYTSSHVLTVVEGGDLELMKEITVTIPVKYVYTFGERTAQIVVNVTK